MENQRNNNKKMQVLAPMPISVCLPSSDDQSSSTTQNVVLVASSSITPLRNHRVFNPRLNRLTAVKRLARNKRKIYQKYGPYKCQWCGDIFKTSQYFAAHMRNHYRIDQKNAFKAAKQGQEDDEPQLTPEALAKVRQNHALRRARAQLEKARRQTEELTALLAQARAKANEAPAQANAPASKRPKRRVRAPASSPPAPAAPVTATTTAPAPAPSKRRPTAPAPAPAPTPTPTPATASPAPAPEPTPTPTPTPATASPVPAPSPAPVRSSSSGIRINDVHLRLGQSLFGVPHISAGDRNHSLTTSSFLNAMDFFYSKRMQGTLIQPSSPAYIHHHYHYHQVPPGFASSSSSSRTPNGINKEVVVKQEVFPDQDVKPPPGFHHLLATGPDGRQFIIKEEKVEFDDDGDVNPCRSLDNLDLKL